MCADGRTLEGPNWTSPFLLSETVQDVLIRIYDVSHADLCCASIFRKRIGDTICNRHSMKLQKLYAFATSLRKAIFPE